MEWEFRGKSVISGRGVKEGDWIYGQYVKNYPSVAYGKVFEAAIFYSIEGKGYRIPVNPATVGLWTGLTDKNGVKIFEGDTIRAFNFPDNEVEVVFVNGAFGYYWHEEFVSFAQNTNLEWKDGKSEFVEVIHDEEG
jgi:hypothetical protein